MLNHNEERGVLARSKFGNGSLELTIDDTGLRYKFDAPNTQLGDEIIISVIATDFSEEYDFSAVPNLSTLRPRPVAEKEEEHEEKEENNVIPSYLQNQK